MGETPRETPFERLVAAVREVYGDDAQIALVILREDVLPPADIWGYLEGMRLDAEPWLRDGLDAALDFAASKTLEERTDV